MRSCGSAHSKKGLKSPSGEENGDGSATLWGSLPPTSPACPLSATLKGSGGRADRRSLGEGQFSRNMRTWGFHGRKWNGLQKIGSNGRLWWKPYALVGVKMIKLRKLDLWDILSCFCASSAYYLVEHCIGIADRAHGFEPFKNLTFFRLLFHNWSIMPSYI